MESIGFRFWQTFIKWQRQIDIVLAPLDLTQQNFSILALIGWQLQQNVSISTPYIRQKVIVEMSGMPKMQVSLILQRLKKSKLITISPYPLDLREQQVELTDEGLDLLRKAITLVEEVDNKTLSQENLLRLIGTNE
ncbi:hypothetical protein AXH23_14225 [Acinetobacter pittii]|nr:hypothetical protein AXH23_14225 [Acinetobacter pittii]